MHKRFAVGGLGLVAALAVIIGGCSRADDKGSHAKVTPKAIGETEKHSHDDGHDHAKDDTPGHSLGGWWCDEHGIPEEECSMCSAKVEKESKSKGDWCREHERALSQCFHCKPEQRKLYAAKHRAKAGKEPPPIPEFDEKKPKEGEKDKKDGGV